MPEDFTKYIDEDLYKYIIREDVRHDLIESLNRIGILKLKEHGLVKEVRRRCEQDLWFLGKYFLWDTDVVGAGRPIEENFMCEAVHRRVCDMFVKKDRTKKLSEQDWRKDRLVLYPRGTGKSAWDRYDTVQYVLNFPEIRILYLTAEQTLAQGFVSETKSHFLLRPDDPSLMNLFFPEFCLTDNDSGAADKFACPAAEWVKKGVQRKEPTIWGSSVESTLSGRHFEVIKADDSVSDENSSNDVQCKKIASKFNLKRKMLVPTGYVDKIGTRYADEDMYGEDLTKNVGTNIKREIGPNWEIIDNLDTGLRVLIGRSIVIKPETKEKLERENRQVTYAEAGKDGCSLLWPEYHSYEWCMYEYGKNEVIFEGQQNQNPRSAVNTTFDRPLMLKHTIPFNDPIVPNSGPISQFWDFAYSTAKGRDYSTGTCCIWNKNRQCIVIDMIRAKFKPLDLAKAVVQFAVKYKPYIVGVEQSGGSELIQTAIEQEAFKTNIPEVINVLTKIDWVKASNQKDAKNSRMRQLHPWIAGDMMYFVSHLMPDMNVFYDEFERCLSGGHHNDIPDCLSYQPRYAPRMLQLIQNNDLQMFSKADGSWQMTFDTSGELYGPAENFYKNPFQGLVLTNDPDNPGVLKWMSEPLPNPIVSIQTEQEVTPAYNENGLDAVLGVF